MKLSSMFIGKLVKGIRGKVLPVQAQDNEDEPIGVIVDFEWFEQFKRIHPIVWWVGEDKDLAHGVHPANLQELD